MCLVHLVLLTVFLNVKTKVFFHGEYSHEETFKAPESKHNEPLWKRADLLLTHI